MPSRARAAAAFVVALASLPCLAAAAGRPPLEQRQGRYFRWSMPAGWRFTESTNGVTLYAPDDHQRAGFVLLLRSPGASTPTDFLLRFLPMDGTYRNLRVEGRRPQPDVRGAYPGRVWKVEELTVSLTVNGKPSRGVFSVAICNAWGQFDAFVGYAHAVAAEWPAARQFLPQLTRSIRITNPGQVAMNDQLLRPRNNPLDNSGLIESWRQKGISESRISQARREGTMGYERMKDPVTGRKWDMPLETYDGAFGGYRNPERPHERLEKAPAGE